MARYLSESDVYNLLGERGMATVHCSQIDVLPRADVAPRAEIDKLQKVNADLNESLRLACEANKDLQAKVDRWRFGLEAVLEERAEDRVEVAREIFEEIEEHLRGIFDFFRQDNDIRESCAIMFALSEITKLKKKYTGDAP